MQNKAALLCVLGIVHLICCPGSQWSSGKGLSCAAAHALSVPPLGRHTQFALWQPPGWHVTEAADSQN